MTTNRIEIQNLRGISILSVFLFHLFPSTFKNGYIGVDVFFVISGYLITQQLLKTKKLSLSEYLTYFYFRRIKRIIPAALSAITLTLIAAYALLGIITLVQNLESASWANLFAANWFFLDQNLDYFAAGQLQLLQHYWSLAIEEQFYLIWPVLLYFNKSRLLFPITLLITSLGTFIASGYPGNFFGAQARAWELLAGSLLAIRPLKIKFLIGSWFPWIFVLISILPFVISREILVIASVVMATLYLAAAKSLLKSGPIYKLGQISFSLYLIHYPVILIFDELYPSTTAWIRVLAISITVAIATLFNYKFVENFFRYRTYKKQKKVILSGLLAILILQMTILAIRSYYV